MENHKDWRDRLDQNEAPMDTGKFWDSLESKIPAAQVNKKKRRVFFWLLVFLIGSGVTVGGIILTKPEKEVKDLATNESVKQEMATTEENRNSLIYSEKDESEVLSVEAIAEIKSPEKASNALINTSRSDQNFQIKTSSSPSNLSIASTNQNMDNPGEVKPAAEMENPSLKENALQTELITANKDHTTKTEIENQIAQKSSELAEQKSTVASLEYLPTITTELSSHQYWNFGSMPAFDNIQNIKPKKSGWQYWMDLSYGVGMGFHSFSTSDPLIQSYLDNRLKHESTLESRLAVWENRLIHPSGLYVSTGLRYQSHITRFDWAKEETKLEWKLADGFVEDAQGNQIAVRDSAWQSYRELRELRQHNKISTLDIPLNIGYLMRRNHFSIEFAVGVTANIAQYSSGKQLNLEGQPIKWNDTNELSFKEFSTGWGASAMLRGTWYPTEYLGIFVQPSFHKDLSNRMITEAGYSHKVDFLGVQAGLSFMLFGNGR